MNISIERFDRTDVDEYNLFLEKIITDGFIDTGIDITKEKQHLMNEINFQKNRVIKYPKQYYLAKMNNRIVGSIAFMDPCEAVKSLPKKCGSQSGKFRKLLRFMSIRISGKSESDPNYLDICSLYCIKMGSSISR